MSDEPSVDTVRGSGSRGALFSEAVRFVVEQARQGVERSAAEGRSRLEKRQLVRDREAMWQKLGREVCTLVAAGEVEHPGLCRGAERVQELEQKFDASAATEKG
jgi:hypothetical protein